LKSRYDFATENIESVDVTTFLTAYHIVGCGSYGNRKEVYSKEQADHSLPYVIAVALLDEKVYPDQFLSERIKRSDVQELLQKVNVHTNSPIHKPLFLAALTDPYTESYPEKVPAKVEITFNDGKKIKMEKEDYHGFFTRPLSWDDVVQKFRSLAGNTPPAIQEQVIQAVADLEKLPMSELISPLAGINLKSKLSNLN
jgi:2-methylcitrate dehydratase